MTPSVFQDFSLSPIRRMNFRFGLIFFGIFYKVFINAIIPERKKGL